MNKLIFFLFFPLTLVLNLSLAKSSNIFCNFEEVYLNSQTQEGLLMIKDSKIRYEYKKHNLFTIFVDKEQFILIQNFEKDKKHQINLSDDLFQITLDLMKKYPAKIEEYKKNGFDIKFEKSIEFDFYKRISIKSKDHNLSIYFYNCQTNLIEDKYFSLDPVFEIRN